MKKTGAPVLAALLAIAHGAAAQVIVGDGPFSEYTQRIDKVTPGAGDAKEHNAAIHIINPAPRAAYNRSIPGNGERMSRTIRRYEDVTKLQEAARPIQAEIDVAGGASSKGK